MPVANVTAGANLGFKVGTQQNVDYIITQTTGHEALFKTAVEGTFYLTQDTHRLYVGNNDGSLSPVNEGILKFNNMDALRAALNNSTGSLAGRFAYISSENILAVHNGSQWVQINVPGSDTTVASFTNTSQTLSDVSIAICHDITDTAGDTFSSRYALQGADGVKVSVGTNVNITVNGRQYSVPTFVITGDKYTLSAANGDNGTTNQVKLHLESANSTNDSDVTLAAGSNSNMIISRNGNVINFSAEDTTNASLTISNVTNGFNFKITDSAGNDVNRDFKPSFTYGANSDVTYFNSGNVTLDVYSKGDIDSKIQTLNAMHYVGTLGQGGSAGTTFDATTGRILLTSGGSSNPVNVSVGDTFLTTSALVYNGTAIPVGSLVICKGTEDTTTGYITSNYDYDIVKATQNTDTQYKFKATATGVELVPVINGAEDAAVGQLIFSAGNTDVEIGVSSASTTGGGAKQTIEVSHKTYSAPTTTNGTAILMEEPTTTNGYVGSKNVTVVTGVTTSNGHLTGVEKTQITLTDSASRITSQTGNGTVYTSGGTTVGVIRQAVTETYSSGDTNTSYSYMGINSDSLTIEADNTQQRSTTDTATVGGLKINMVWGSF